VHACGTRKIGTREFARVLTVLAIGIAAPSAHGQDSARFTAATLIIEYNASARDLGVQFFLDAEEWQYVRILDPSGNKVFEATARGRLLKQGGGTELFVESVEPERRDVSLQEFFNNFPAGTYPFRGHTRDGVQLFGKAVFTHVIPSGPEITLPVPAGEDQCTANVEIPAVIAWNDVTTTIRGTPLEVDRYEVIVERDDEVAIFDVHLPPGSPTMVTVPTEFLEPGTEYVFEVLAIEAGGNQTISEGCFQTAN
jgi:hypothetical protein